MSDVPSSVLLLTNHLTTGGAEIYVLTVARWLTQQGARVAVAASPGELVARLDPAVTYHPVRLDDVRLGIGRAALQIRRLVRQHKPDVIIANSMVTAVIARLASLRHSIPVVAVAHGWPAERYRLIAPPLRVADKVIAVSGDVARQLQKSGLPSSKCIIVPNGVDLSPFGPRSRDQLHTAREAFGASSEDVVVVSVGRFVDQKAQHHILEIADALREQLPELRYGIIGWGPLEDQLRAEIERRDLGHLVKLLVRRSDVPDLLMASDIYLNTSTWEGMPLSMIEAMAAGLPIVTTDVEGMSALVSSENGMLAPVGDVESLTDAVRRLGRDEVMRLQRGSESRARAEHKFSKEVMCRRLTNVLLEAMASR